MKRIKEEKLEFEEETSGDFVAQEEIEPEAPMQKEEEKRRDRVSFLFCDFTVPLSKDTFVGASVAVAMVKERGLESDIEIEPTREGILVTLYNDIGINNQYFVNKSPKFVIDNPEGLWNQFKTLMSDRIYI